MIMVCKVTRSRDQPINLESPANASRHESHRAGQIMSFRNKQSTVGSMLDALIEGLLYRGAYIGCVVCSASIV